MSGRTGPIRPGGPITILDKCRDAGRARCFRRIRSGYSARFFPRVSHCSAHRSGASAATGRAVGPAPTHPRPRADADAEAAPLPTEATLRDERIALTEECTGEIAPDDESVAEHCTSTAAPEDAKVMVALGSSRLGQAVVPLIRPAEENGWKLI